MLWGAGQQRKNGWACITVMVGLWAWATAVLAAGALGAHAVSADFHVYINDRKESGHPWHGPGDIFVMKGKVATHLPDAPSAVLCIVRKDGSTTCPGRRSGSGVDKASEQRKEGSGPPASAPRGLEAWVNRPPSPCPSSRDCDFKAIALPPDEIFGVVVIDPAMVFINLVDAVVVTRKLLSEKEPEVVAFDGRLREALAKLAPPGPFESKRRLRQFPVRTLDECRKGCKFTQSELLIEPH